MKKLLGPLLFILLSYSNAYAQFSLAEQQALKEMVNQWLAAGSVLSGGHIIEDEGTPLTPETNLNFVGAGVTAADSGGKTVVTINGGGGGGHVIEEEGTPLTQETNLNFVGAGVTAADSGGKTVVTVSTPNLNTLTTGLTASRCVRTDGSSILASATGDCYVVGGTDVAIADGGTGASTAAGALAALGTNSIATQQGGGLHACMSASITDSYTCTMTPTLTAYTTNMTVLFKASAVANIGAATLTIDGLATITILTATGTTLADNDIAIGAYYLLSYNGTNFIMPRTGLNGESDTLDTVFDRGKVINGADSFANAMRITDATGDGWAFYRDSSLGPIRTGICGGVENDCNYVTKLNSGKTYQFQNSTGTSKGTLTESTGVWTNLSYDDEGTGNVHTTYYDIQLDAASCVEATASNLWDDDATGMTRPTAQCNDTGTIQRPSSGFAGGAVNGYVRTINLPSNWTGAIDIKLRYVIIAATPANSVQWDIETVCRAAGESWDGSFNTKQTITSTVGSQFQPKDAIQTGITTTGCSGDEDLTLRVSRNGTADSNNDTAHLLWVKLKLREAK